MGEPGSVLQPGSGRIVRSGQGQHDAKAVCKTCPVLAQCLAEALDNRTEFGVWGGMTERERRALLRRRPDIVSGSPLRAGMASQPRD